MRTIADSRTASTELRSWATFERDDCEVDELAALWEDLTELFQANPPVPARIMRPIMGRPAETLLETYTADMADADLPMDAIEAWATRRAHESVVDALPPYRPISHIFHGQGIVILAGARYAGYAATSIGVLRQLGSELPIELWAKDEIEEDQLWCEELVLQGVACKRISDYAILGSRWDWVNPSAWLSKPLPWSPYQWKVMTILFSSFEEVLFLDADSIPVLDPAFLFDSDVYRENGVVLWPDRWPSIASRWLPYLVGLTDTKSDAMWYQQTVESGQMLWNKRTHWKSLLLACYYNNLGQSFWYTATIGSGPGWGDKDTFLIALQALREPHYLVPGRPEPINALGSSIVFINLQFDPTTSFSTNVTAAVTDLGTKELPETSRNGPIPTSASARQRPLFMHACGGLKWSLRDLANAYWMRKPIYYAWTYVNPRYALAHILLRARSRLLTPLQAYPDFDPEPSFWRALEHSACWSRAMGSVALCDWTKDHIRETFCIT